MLALPDDIRASLPPGREFDAVMELTGVVHRRQKNRRTIETSLAGRRVFAKIHHPTSWREIAKNALRGRWPVLSARTEWRAIQRLDELGIATTPAIGFGERGRFPHRLESFIITEALEGMIHLSELPPALASLPRRQRIAIQRQAIAELAAIAQALHRHGLNHRDFYLGHFMTRRREWSQWRRGETLDLHLIDLHRVQVRRRTPTRWVIKDISGLLFSALDANLRTRDCVRFLRAYWGSEWKARWRASRWWRWRVLRRAVSLYRSEHGRPPRLPAGLASFA